MFYVLLERAMTSSCDPHSSSCAALALPPPRALATYSVVPYHTSVESRARQPLALLPVGLTTRRQKSRDDGQHTPPRPAGSVPNFPVHFQSCLAS
jgi:hypothetical protein